MGTPREVMHRLARDACFGVVLDSGRRRGRPGEMVERQSADVRALLRELRSDDIADVAPHEVRWMVDR